MKTEVNAEKVNDLRTQIAIMQRELEKELEGESTAQSSGQIPELN